jgi:ketosteroid isomerase-like protein
VLSQMLHSLGKRPAGPPAGRHQAVGRRRAPSRPKDGRGASLRSAPRVPGITSPVYGLRQPSGHHELLYALSCAYARAVDQRDSAGFVDVFEPDATLRITAASDPARVVRTIDGHDQLAAVPQRIARYDRTFHLLGQASYDDHPDGDRATGEVHCVAHHLTVRSPEAQNSVMYIRYADAYRRGGDGRWRIADRLVQVDWTETRPADDPTATP